MRQTKSVKLEDFTLELDNIVQDLGVVIASKLADVVGEVAEEFRQEIPVEMVKVGLKRDPSHTKHLADSWVATPIVDTGTQKVVRIHAINGKSRIVHLLENNHRLKNGGTFQGRHFLQHLIDKYSPIMENKVKETIAKGEGL